MSFNFTGFEFIEFDRETNPFKVSDDKSKLDMDAAIREMKRVNQTMSIRKIADELKVNYQKVYRVLKGN